MKKAFQIFVAIFMFLTVFYCQNHVIFVKNTKITNVSAALAIDDSVTNSSESYKAMIVIEGESGRVLTGKNHTTRLPMASTTKILTAIMVLESAIDIDIRYPLPSPSIGVEGSSMFLRKEEHFSIRELLYGLMLSSGNDSATALAILVFGSEREFVTSANAFVQKLGLTDTKITNPHGLHDDEHYTTAYDLAKLAVYAMKNKDFRDIVATRQYDIKKSPTNEQRIMKNKNKILKDYDFSTGVKTGFTPEAGRCLVASATKNNMELVCVLLNCSDMEEQGERLLEECFGAYTMTEVLSAHNHISSIPVKNSKFTEVNIYSKENFVYPITEAENALIRIEYDYPVALDAPVESGQVVGKVRVKLSNQLLFECDIYTIEKADNNEIKYIIKKLIRLFA